MSLLRTYGTEQESTRLGAEDGHIKPPSIFEREKLPSATLAEGKLCNMNSSTIRR